MGKSVILPLTAAQGTRIFVGVDPKFPYTVLSNSSAPAGKRGLAVIDKDEPVITMSGAVDVRSLCLIGNVDQEAGEATKKALDKGSSAPIASGPFRRHARHRWRWQRQDQLGILALAFEVP